MFLREERVVGGVGVLSCAVGGGVCVCMCMLKGVLASREHHGREALPQVPVMEAVSKRTHFKAKSGGTVGLGGLGGLRFRRVLEALLERCLVARREDRLSKAARISVGQISRRRKR